MISSWPNVSTSKTSCHLALVPVASSDGGLQPKVRMRYMDLNFGNDNRSFKNFNTRIFRQLSKFHNQHGSTSSLQNHCLKCFTEKFLWGVSKCLKLIKISWPRKYHPLRVRTRLANHSPQMKNETITAKASNSPMACSWLSSIQDVQKAAVTCEPNHSTADS